MTRYTFRGERLSWDLFVFNVGAILARLTRDGSSVTAEDLARDCTLKSNTIRNLPDVRAALNELTHTDARHFQALEPRDGGEPSYRFTR